MIFCMAIMIASDDIYELLQIIVLKDVTTKELVFLHTLVFAVQGGLVWIVIQVLEF